MRPPDYYLTGVPAPGPAQPTVNTAEDIERLRAACSLARRILSEASRLATPGVTTDEIDQLVTRLAFEAGAYPSPLNYRHFPKSVCTSGICLSTYVFMVLTFKEMRRESNPSSFQVDK